MTPSTDASVRWPLLTYNSLNAFTHHPYLSPTFPELALSSYETGASKPMNDCIKCSATSHICVLCIYLRTDCDLCHLQHKLVFITAMKSVYSAVRTGSLNKAVCALSLKGQTKIIFSNSVRISGLSQWPEAYAKIIITITIIIIIITIQRLAETGVIFKGSRA
jgi:hypothetical protein